MLLARNFYVLNVNSEFRRSKMNRNVNPEIPEKLLKFELGTKCKDI